MLFFILPLCWLRIAQPKAARGAKEENIALDLSALPAISGSIPQWRLLLTLRALPCCRLFDVETTVSDLGAALAGLQGAGSDLRGLVGSGVEGAEGAAPGFGAGAGQAAAKSDLGARLAALEMALDHQAGTRVHTDRGCFPVSTSCHL